MTATVVEETSAEQITRAAAAPLAYKVYKVTYQSDDTTGPVLDFRGFRKLTCHAPTPPTTSGLTTITMKASPTEDGTFGTVNDNDEVSDVEFTPNGKANSTIRCAGMGFLRPDLDAAYETGTTGSDTVVYFVAS